MWPLKVKKVSTAYSRKPFSGACLKKMTVQFPTINQLLVLRYDYWIDWYTACSCDVHYLRVCATVLHEESIPCIQVRYGNFSNHTIAS
ncbi:hypothetical protein ANCCAN_17823 [Ancylostoma caninum]|uniref:Uncharacterized protein n=1 Tax=Ancylostoma caninum TaxID=29170 RepID=A0A368FZS9_ANCCA|nr:hypothetical protein ANCCAN_17823 [Ancylostoma caninum]